MFETYQSKPDLQAEAAGWIESHLQDALQRRDRAVLMLSGGSTPGPIYQRLADANLEWDKVTIGLADERWVEEDHPASNSAMVRRTLLAGKATAATYLPMKRSGADPFVAAETLASDYAPALHTDVLVLGMGPDAHTLSWFAGGRGYDQVVDPQTPSPVGAVEAIESDVTGPNLLRMTLTYRCVANARHVLLIITGDDKKRVFETASEDAPVSRMRRAAGAALSVYYCP